MINGTLYTHLAEINRQTEEMFSELVNQMKAREGITEQLKAENQLEWVSRRIDNLIEMRSDGEIDKADFMKRKTEAEQKHMELQNKIAEREAEQNKTTPVIDYKEKLEVLRYALEQYTDFDADGDIPDSVIEAFVEKIVVSKDGYDWYLRFDGDPGDPLHLKTEGKRRKSTTIIDPNKQTACEPVRDSGCYQEQVIC